MVILSSSLRRLGLACIVPILSVWLVPAGAQAQFVTVNVRTSPQVAQPGDDVDVSARVAGFITSFLNTHRSTKCYEWYEHETLSKNSQKYIMSYHRFVFVLV